MALDILSMFVELTERYNVLFQHLPVLLQEQGYLPRRTSACIFKYKKVNNNEKLVALLPALFAIQQVSEGNSMAWD